MHRSAVTVLVALLTSACAASGAGGGDGNGAPELIVPGGGAGAPAATIPAIVRDFRFYDPLDPTTNADFEDPPVGLGQNGQPSPGYMGPWDDPNVVTDALGDDGTPVYAMAQGQTTTTHGAAAFQQWYHDVPGTNWRVQYPLPLMRDPAGDLQYDSELQGVPYGPTVPDTGNGFFPIDDGSAYATPFGDQGKAHNYSFTVEIHTTFTYEGGETFLFRGDDDVFVFIAGQRVINLGGVHGPEEAQVDIDSLGLTLGQSYPLDFFSAERHVTGSNIRFQTNLALQPVAIGQ